MNTTKLDEPKPGKPLRLWPGVLIVIIPLFLRFVVPLFVPGTLYVGVIGGVLGGIAVVIWWLFFSRSGWSERLAAVLLMIAALFLTYRLIHPSIAKGGMGMLFWILSVPMLSIAFVAWAVITRRSSDKVRRVTMVATIFLACGVWTLIRTGGFTGEFDHDFAWRWSKTPEERLLEKTKNERVAIQPAPVPAEPQQQRTQTQAQTQTGPLSQTQTQTDEKTVEEPVAPVATVKEADWPGFRGAARDSTIRGVRIKTDWTASPPVALWRKPIGPGWSSFAVNGNHFYTQEQRGDDELVSCYNITTGEPVWRHSDAARFWESNAGAGPRGTPTLSNGRVYTLGATGILNSLNAVDGSVQWSRNVGTDTKTETPTWGFSSSPVVIDDLVIVASSGQLAAYDLATGKPRWVGPKGGTDYSSPHQVTIDGVKQILFMSRPGAISFAPADGAMLWKHALPEGTRIVQPALTPDGDVLISEGDESGMRRIAVSKGSAGWTVEERWRSIGLKPYFSDFVIHNGHTYGFDGSYLSCIDLKDGNKKWKGGKFGHGQMALLADQDVLLILSEKGELGLVAALPDQFKELARVPAIEGKTWNHPVLVRDTLLVRNGEEMAAFRLTLAGK